MRHQQIIRASMWLGFRTLPKSVELAVIFMRRALNVVEDAVQYEGLGLMRIKPD
jgi:hypothetical protein